MSFLHNMIKVELGTTLTTLKREIGHVLHEAPLKVCLELETRSLAWPAGIKKVKTQHQPAQVR